MALQMGEYKIYSACAKSLQEDGVSHAPLATLDDDDLVGDIVGGR